jgi:hypothetical protein
MLGMLLRARYRLRPRTTTAREERVKVLERGAAQGKEHHALAAYFFAQLKLGRPLQPLEHSSAVVTAGEN